MESFFTGDFTLKGKPRPAENEPSPPAARADCGAEGDSLEKIAEEICACRKCRIGSTRTRAVPGEGSPHARLVFVGEAPGVEEDQQGRPFVGRAGKLLTDIITAMGLQRQDVFITNVIKCRPPENRDPKLEEIMSCRPFLIRQLELIRPEVIVALGAHAAKTLLETDVPIGQLRGRFHEYRYSDNAPPAKLMPTYHPAYLLRNYSYDNRKRVWEDMVKVLKELGLPVPKKKKDV
ncbi:MAG: uracil-DNA glycosylase [Planctomycetaceae bacterium]|nr:uracil-DNA glycosylase [Planctomycetaceae bacterium]